MRHSFLFQKELFSENSKEKASTSEEINKQENIDPNLQLCFDLATETVKHTPDNHHRLRNFETRRTFENVCDIVTYVARRARQQTSDQQSVATVRNGEYTLCYFLRKIKLVLIEDTKRGLEKGLYLYGYDGMKRDIMGYVWISLDMIIFVFIAKDKDWDMMGYVWI